MCRSGQSSPNMSMSPMLFTTSGKAASSTGSSTQLRKRRARRGSEPMRESEVIERLRRIATAPEARGLRDDVAVLGDLIVTHDSIAEGVHFLRHDPPASVGWKLVAVNLSDLAAKGGKPVGALLSLTISGAGDWEQAFLGGIE